MERDTGHSRSGWLLLGILCAGMLASWSVFYADFVMPNPDFVEFQKIAEAIYEGWAPDVWKRMPVYSLLFGLVAQPLRPILGAEGFAYLHGALLLNLALSVGILVLLYLLSQRLIGRAGLLVPIILATTPFFSVMVNQPLLEPCLGFCVLLSLYLTSLNTDRAYVAGMLCSLTRHEGVILIPIHWAVSCVRSPRQWLRHTLRAALACAPLALWFTLTSVWVRHPHAKAYVEEISGMEGHYGWAKLPLMFIPYYQPRLLESVMFLLPAALGVVVGLRRFPLMTLAILAYFVWYCAIHVVFGVYLPRYAYGVLWVTPLFAVTGGHAALQWLWARMQSHTNLRRIACGLVLLASVLWLTNAWLDFGWPRVESGLAAWPYVATSAFILACAAWAGYLLAGAGREKLARLTLGLTLAALLAVPTLMGERTRALELGFARHANTEQALIAAWLRDHATARDRAVVPDTKWQYFDQDHALRPRVSNLLHLSAENLEAFDAELRGLGVRYVIVPEQRKLPTDPADPNYYAKRYWYHHFNCDLVEPFRGGGEVEGFHRVAELSAELPENMGTRPVWVYELQAASAHASE